MIWKYPVNLEALNKAGENSLSQHLGIEMIGFGDDYLEARMPVDHRTVQPMGILHGGASVALAETIGSVASTLCIEDHSKQTVVGVEISANHLKSKSSGYVYARATPYRVGRTMHVWNIEIRDEDKNLVCVSRLTIAIVNRR
jgi:1,4-dihydroxy-2-naphthoyl-CoA hydrolase